MRIIMFYLKVLLFLMVLPSVAYSAAQLAIEVNPDPVRPESPVEVSLTVTNPGSSRITNVELRLNYPEHLNYIDTPYISTGGASNSVSCIDTRCSSGEVVVWSLGIIPPGSGVSVSMAPWVLNVPDGTLIQFDAEVRVDGIQEVQGSKAVTVKSSPLFELRVDEHIDPVSSSGDLLYTFTYGNVGGTSSDTLLSFPLPDHTSFVSATDGGTYADGKVTWNLQSLASGSGGERRVHLSVDGAEGDLLELDSAEISGTDSSYVEHRMQASRATRLEDDAKPGLSLNINPDPVRPEKPVHVGLNVTNPGSSPMTNVELRLNYPQHLDYIDTPYISTGGDSNSVSCTDTRCWPGEVVVWELGTIPVGGGVAVEMQPWVSDVADGTLIQFEVELWVDGIQELQLSKTVTVKGSPTFELCIDEHIDPVSTSGDLLYTFTYGNVGGTFSDTLLSFPLPDHTSFVSATDGGTYSEGTVSWDLQSLASGSGGERRVHLSVDGAEGDLLELDSVVISGTDSSYIEHTMQASRATRLEDDAKPGLSLNITPDPVRPEKPVHVGLTVTNPGSSPMTNVELRLNYPQHLNYIDTPYISTGGASNSVSCTDTRCWPGEVVLWKLGTIPVGGGVSVSMAPWILNVPDGTLIQFETELWVDGVQELQLSKTVTVKGAPTFELSVDEHIDPVSTSGDLLYTFTYGNIGGTSSDTLLSFPLPDHTSFVSATDGGTYSEGTVSWDLQSLASGSGGERRVHLSVDGAEGDLLELDSAEISGTDSSYVEHRMQASRATRLEDNAKPGLSLNITPDPVRPEKPVHVGLTVTNPGSSPMTNVELRLNYPQHLDYIDTPYISTGGASNSVSCTDTRCWPGEVVLWTLGTIPVGGGVSVEMQPWVSDVADGTLIQFEVELWVDGIQKLQRSKTVTVKGAPTFELSVDEHIDPVSISGDLLYTLTYSNVGTTSSDTRLSFRLPDHTNFISATDGGNYSESYVSWDLQSLASGSGGERRVRVAVDGAEGDYLELDCAEISGMDSSYMKHKIQAGRTIRLEDDEKPELSLTLNPDPVLPDDPLNVSLTVTNPGSSPMTNVELRLRYPQHLNYIDTQYISTGDSSNSVSCVDTRCWPGEFVVWNLNMIPAGQSVNVEMTPNVLDVSEGTHIPFDAELRVDGKQVVSISKTVFAGSNFDSTGYPPICADINNDADVTLEDLIMVLQIMAGKNISLSEHGDCSGDGIAGLPEALSILHELQ